MHGPATQALLPVSYESISLQPFQRGTRGPRQVAGIDAGAPGDLRVRVRRGAQLHNVVQHELGQRVVRAGLDALVARRLGDLRRGHLGDRARIRGHRARAPGGLLHSGFLPANSNWWYIARSHRNAQTTRSTSAIMFARELMLVRLDAGRRWQTRLARIGMWLHARMHASICSSIYIVFCMPCGSP